MQSPDWRQFEEPLVWLVAENGSDDAGIRIRPGLINDVQNVVVEGKWKILGVTTSGPREAFVVVEEVNNKLLIRVRATVGEISPVHSLTVGNRNYF